MGHFLPLSCTYFIFQTNVACVINAHDTGDKRIMGTIHDICSYWEFCMIKDIGIGRKAGLSRTHNIRLAVLRVIGIQ